MRIAKIAINRPITTMMMVLIIILLGVVSASKLAVDLLPELDIPVAVVSTSYSGAGPKEIETLVTRPLEGVLGTVSNVKEITSTSSTGSSMVVLTFNDGTDMNFATLQMRERIDMVKKLLPEGVENPAVLKIDPNARAIMEVAVSGAMELHELNTLVQDQVAPRLERIEGVASVAVSGQKEKEIRIILLPEKLKGYNMTTAQISQALRMENLNLPGGEVQQGEYMLLLRTTGEFDSIDQIRNLPMNVGGIVVYLRDVALVEETFKDVKNYTLINGKPGIKLSLQKQSTANTVQVSALVNAELNKLQNELSHIQVTLISDNAKYIKQSIGTVSQTAVLGGILAILVLYVFLRNIRSTLIIGAAIPVSVIATFVLMYFSGLTLNLISLGGLALGVGMLVDNSIVVLENIYRHRQKGEDGKTAADLGASEVGMAVVASTLTTIAVFLPIVFVEGLAAKIFKQMALTVTFSLIASLVIAMTFVPMLASKLLTNTKEEKHTPFMDKILGAWGTGLDQIDNQYRKVLQWAIDRRKITLAIAFAAFLGTAALVPRIGMEFFPKFDEGTMSIRVNLPKGSALQQTAAIVEQVEEKLQQIPEVKEVVISVGSGGNMFRTSTATDRGTIAVDVGSVKERSRSTDEIVDEVRKLLGDIPGAEFAVEAVSLTTGGMMGGNPISIEVTGDDLEELERVVKELTEIVKQIPGTREITHSMQQGVPEAQIRINRNKASAYGINASMVASTVRTAVEGQVATRYKLQGTEIDVRILYDPTQINYLKDINNLFVPSPMGGQIPLSEIADITVEKSPAAIQRSNQSRRATLSGDVFGRDLKSVSADIEARFAEYPFPIGYMYTLGGQQSEMTESFTSLGLALILAIILVYMILAAQFESLIHPLTIMFSVPISLTGAIFALYVTGRTLNLPAFIGLIMLAGIVVNNAIVLVDYINILRSQGYDRREAILTAGPVRLRPILMTTLTTVLAMIPMALGLGEGAEAQAPMATSVVGGLSFSTLLTLVLIPVMYSIFDDIGQKWKTIREKRKQKKTV